jgi:hypothetical protein
LADHNARLWELGHGSVGGLLLLVATALLLLALLGTLPKPETDGVEPRKPRQIGSTLSMVHSSGASLESEAPLEHEATRDPDPTLPVPVSVSGR